MLTSSVQRMLVKRGFHLISPEVGSRFLIEELASGSLDDVEIIAGEGPWALRSTGFPVDEVSLNGIASDLRGTLALS